MDIQSLPVRTKRDMDEFIHVAWKIHHGDPNWVAPLATERANRLDPERNPFWHDVERELWVARRGAQAVGTLAVFMVHNGEGKKSGYFGFFDCFDDQSAAADLFRCGEAWLRERGASELTGPYNPSDRDEPGVLVEGFDTRPAIMEAHNPSYYPRLFDQLGYQVDNTLVARLFAIPPGMNSVSTGLPEKLLRVAEKAGMRKDLRIRPLDPGKWKTEIRLAWEIYNAALKGVPGIEHVPWEDFYQAAEGFRPIMAPDMALIAEVSGKAAGFALALPDANEAIQRLDGKSGLFQMARLWWGLQRVKRTSFKILMILPEFQGRGIEAVLIREMGKAILRHGFKEVDMSLTGENNEKSQRFQEHLGFKTYRRYHIYRKDLIE